MKIFGVTRGKQDFTDFQKAVILDSIGSGFKDESAIEQIVKDLSKRFSKPIKLVKAYIERMINECGPTLQITPFGKDFDMGELILERDVVDAIIRQLSK
jgi:hypothetical protein